MVSPESVRIIGITGGIASGKSEVAQCFASLGAGVIDADAVGHELLEPAGPAFEAVIQAFGPEILSCGTIDRQKLGARVFGNDAALAKLNKIMYPLLWDVVKRRCEALANAGAGAVVVDAATLCDDGDRPAWVDLLAVVTSSRETRICRLIATRHFSEETARRRVDAQRSQETKMRLADTVIENDGSLAELRLRATALAREWLGHGA